MLDELLTQAKALHQAGRFHEAEPIYLRLLEQDAGDIECLNLLGLLHADTARVDTSVQLLRAAIGIGGPLPWLCRNLGIILERSSELAAAAACYRQALDESSADHELWGTLGRIYTTLDRQQEATHAWAQALDAATPCDGMADVYRLALANALALNGNRAAAVPHYDALLRGNPAHVEATFHRAVAYMQESESPTAIDGFRRTLELDPGHARAANNLGILYQLERDYSKAIQNYQLSIRADSSFHPALYNLGTAWLDNSKPRHAIGVFRKVLRLQPEHVAAWTNLGNAWLACNETKAAVDSYGTALAISPGDATAEWNLGIVNLLMADFRRGWAGYERRFDVKSATERRAFLASAWCGEPLAGKSLLLHAEQGLGDTLQFIRYAAVFQAEGAGVIVECQASLLPLLSGSSLAEEWIAAPTREPGSTASAPVDHLPPTDFHLSLMSAPERFGTTIESIPAPGGYLHAPADCSKRWRKWLGPKTSSLRAGICWAGNPNHKNDRNRSIPADLLADLESANGIEWINLQKGHPVPAALEMRNAARELKDFADTAGLIENLDLVVTVDTSVAHLAGALGKPVWILLPFAPDWRWLLDRSDSPWYAGARLFRQPAPGKWRPVLKQVTGELVELAFHKRRQGKGAILENCVTFRSR